jgi:hypothetical protein
VIASRGMSKGIAQTDGAQFVPKAFVQIGALQVGGQWKNVTSPVAKGEAAVFANATRKLGAFQLTAGAAYKFQTSVREPADSGAFEFSAAATRKFGKLGARVSVVYSPDDFGGTRRSAYFEGGPTLDLSKAFKLSANVGRRERVGSPDYTTFNAGLSAAAHKNLTLEARYYDTAQSDLGEAYHGRIVVLGRLSF